MSPPRSLPPPPTSDAVSKVLGMPELVGEILLRVGDSASLIRAVAVCKAWYGVAYHRVFLRDFMKREPSRFLGYFCKFEDGQGFVPAAQPPELAGVPRYISQAIPEWLDNADDCRGGRILRRFDEALAIYVPFRPESSVFLPLPPLHDVAGDVFTLLRDDNDGSNGPSCVLVTGNVERDAVVVQVSIFQAGQWITHNSDFILVEYSEHGSGIFCNPAVLVGDHVYMLTVNGYMIGAALSDGKIFTVDTPVGFYQWGSHKLSKGEGSVLYVHADGYHLTVWEYIQPNWHQIDRIYLPKAFGLFAQETWNTVKWEKSRQGWGELFDMYTVGDYAMFTCLGIHGDEGLYFVDSITRIVVQLGNKSSPEKGDILHMIPLVMVLSPKLPKFVWSTPFDP